MTLRKTLVSILIPAYNAEKWIRDTILSAINQTWPYIEVIVVDDGSSDNTFAIAKTFESNSVKVVSQENKGASTTRNNCLAMAQGDFIQWLDADDLLAPNKISLQLNAFIGNHLELFSSSFAEFYVNPEKATFIPSVLWNDLEPIDFLLAIFTKNLWMNPSVWLVNRRLAELAGPWDERLSLDDDGEYFSRVVAACDRINFVPEARIYYRRHSVSSLSKSVSDKACESLLLSLSLRIGQLLQLEDSERTRQASINLLQTWLDYFYPEKKDLLNRAYDLAIYLGGTLTPPKLSWKYQPIKTVFGWEAAKRFRKTVSNIKLNAHVMRDELFSAYSRK